jgi:xylose isomerase
LSLYETTLAMLAILKAGGFTTGGLNFDAKIRRNSVEQSDLFEAHIGGMDAFAAGLVAAQRLMDEGALSSFVARRYASFDAGEGARFERGGMSLEELASGAGEYGSVGIASGRQERLENIVSRALLNL